MRPLDIGFVIIALLSAMIHAFAIGMIKEMITELGEVWDALNNITSPTTNREEDECDSSTSPK